MKKTHTLGLLASALLATSLALMAVTPQRAAAGERFEASVAGPEKDGIRITCDLPNELHRRNTESRGLGNCVFTSIHHCAVWQNTPALLEFPRYLIDKGIPGGGFPKKVDDLIARMCRDRGVPVPVYLQVEGADLEVIRLALKTGRMAATTYGLSPTGRYNRQKIAHMVNTVNADRAWVVLDNNYPGANYYEWMDETEFKRAYTIIGGGWCFVLLTPPPPPSPLMMRKQTRNREVFGQLPCPPDLPPATPVIGSNFGVQADQLNADAPAKYRVSGREVTRTQALQLVEGRLADDSRKLRVTVVSADEGARKAAAAALAADATVRDLALVQVYAADHWYVRGKFAEGVYLQEPSGKVLLKTVTLDMPALTRKLRGVPDPAPPAPPGPMPPAPIPGPDWVRAVPWQVWAMGGLLLVLILSRRE